MGRGKKVWPEPMRVLWVPASKGSDNPDWRRVLLSCTLKYLWYAGCSVPGHYRIAQPSTVWRALGLDKAGKGKSSNSRWRCFLCDALATQLSRHVPKVQAAASNSQQPWVPEVHCLRGRFSTADIWILALQLAVMIDGAGHQYVQVHSKTLGEQQDTDWRFDNEVLQQGLRALRLHYRDTEDSSQVESVLGAAMRLCQEQPSTPFVMYSPSYNRPIKWEVDADYLGESCLKRQRQ